MNQYALVRSMNNAFGNEPHSRESYLFKVDFPSWLRLKKQCMNILDEIKELESAPTTYDRRDAICDIRVFTLGAAHFMNLTMSELKMEEETGGMSEEMDKWLYVDYQKSLVIAYNSLMAAVEKPSYVQTIKGLSVLLVLTQKLAECEGQDLDADMSIVVGAVMTRFIKDDADKIATITKHAAKGVTEVYFEGKYPTLIMKSASDQPDAPKGKFLKSASYKEPVFTDKGMSPELDSHEDAIRLVAEDIDLLNHLIENPPKPNEAYIKAMHSYKDKIADGSLRVITPQ